jgi:hypothetical protein
MDVTLQRIAVGIYLRRLRESAALSPRQAAPMLELSESGVIRLERGQAPVRAHLVLAAASYYGAADHHQRTLSRLVELLDDQTPGARAGSMVPQWLVLYLGIEQIATRIMVLQNQIVPGLLQTRGYADTILSYGVATGEARQELLNMRILRQQLMTGPQAPPLWFILDEAVLRRRIGDRDTMRAQLYHLLAMSATRNITIQILPYHRGGRAAVGGPFSILDIDHPDLEHLVYLEARDGATFYGSAAEAEYRRIFSFSAVEALAPHASHELIQEFAKEYVSIY